MKLIDRICTAIDVVRALWGNASDDIARRRIPSRVQLEQAAEGVDPKVHVWSRFSDKQLVTLIRLVGTQQRKNSTIKRARMLKSALAEALKRGLEL